MKKIISLLILILIFGFGLFLGGENVSAVDPYGIEATGDASGLSKYNSPPPVLVGTVVGAALSMVGIIFFILVVYGGILWMTARGNEEQTKKALQTIIAASIGIVIVLSSYAITSFVLDSVNSSIEAPDGTPEE